MGRPIKKHRRWTRKEDRYMREHYADGDTQEIADVLRRSVSAVYKRAKILCLRKTDEYRSAMGIKLASTASSQQHRFCKGMKHPFEGKRWWQFMPQEAQERCRRTTFQKGNIPHNAHPVGYERVNEDGYVLVKVPGRRKMVFKHRWLWEQYHGEIPKGYVVTFIDGNRMNCVLSNLRCCRRGDLKREQMLSEDPEKRRVRVERSVASRKELIRKDKMRIRWGLEPKTRLVKNWYMPEKRQAMINQ